MAHSPVKKTVSLSTHTRYRDVGGEGVLVHLDRGRVIVVNEIGLFIVQQLQRPTTEHNLVVALVDEFEVSSDQAKVDLQPFLARLDHEQILDHGE